MSKVKPRHDWGIPYRSGADIRQSYIDFFTARGHQFIPSSPVVPQDDPTLLFINSGMNQFKAIFLGDNRKNLKRAVNSQKCLRASGKHNDLDDVGRDTYHQTFFEMLGNWSFGDYYKKDAIKWSWELLTEVWKLPKDRLFATIYNNDDEAEQIWKTETDIAHDRIMRFGEKSNFWEMGEVGPCGPCTEIHFDMGDLATQAATFKDPIEGVNGTNARYIELWNNVFMQFERMQNRELKPLKSKHVDTGMGFERICSVIQMVGSNYETDMFRPLIDKIAALTATPYDEGVKGTPHRVIADHVRCLSFAIADGATPGNEGRGYVLRRILRRASRFSQELNQKEPFIYKLVPTLAEVMGQAFPEIAQRADYIAQVIEAEEARFMRTLKDGLARLAKITDDMKAKKLDTIAGQDVFTLYDTYGFPMDLTGVLAEERGLKIDQAGFESAMNEQRERARSGAKFDASLTTDEGWIILDASTDAKFVGYDKLESPVEVTRYREVGDDVLLCLKQTPFYAEGGGQVGDVGTIKGPGIELRVTDTFKILEMHVHKCALVNGLLKKENLKGLVGTVDATARTATVRNHSATHLLHAALRQVLGPHVQQQGSRVAPEGLRFDFTHPKGVSESEIKAIEDLVNDQVLMDSPIVAAEQSLAEAKAQGAMALFGEKYGDRVRSLKMGAFSHELCGGTHARATGQIGLVKITGESSVAAGIRRIEAVTGTGALQLLRQQTEIVDRLSREMKTKPNEVVDKFLGTLEKLKVAEKAREQMLLAGVNQNVQEMIDKDGQVIGGVRVVIKKIDAGAFPRSTHQAMLDSLVGKLNNGVAVLTQVEDGTLSVLAAVGGGAQGKLKAGDLVKELSTVAGGKGGGRPDRAQAGSKFPEKESAVLEEARRLCSRLLG
jgi:alanyl-tRNA synthetase